jgi:hypothetical protein
MLLAQSMCAMFPGVCAARRKGTRSVCDVCVCVCVCVRARLCVYIYIHTYTNLDWLFQVACKDFSAQDDLISIFQFRTLPENAPEVRVLDGKSSISTHVLQRTSSFRAVKMVPQI